MSGSSIITIEIDKPMVSFVLQRAHAAAIGGRSNVYLDKEDRGEKLLQDQFVSQAAQYALSKWLTGDIHAWRFRRLELEKTPRRGNKGQQLQGSNVIVKSSKLRSGGDPMDYRLVVRPRERNAEAVYVLGVVEYDFDEDRDKTPKNVKVHLVGWAHDENFPLLTESSGPFQGAHIIPATELWPLPRFTWGVLANEAKEATEDAEPMTLKELAEARTAPGKQNLRTDTGVHTIEVVSESDYSADGYGPRVDPAPAADALRQRRQAEKVVSVAPQPQEIVVRIVVEQK